MKKLILLALLAVMAVPGLARAELSSGVVDMKALEKLDSRALKLTDDIISSMKQDQKANHDNEMYILVHLMPVINFTQITKVQTAMLDFILSERSQGEKSGASLMVGAACDQYIDILSEYLSNAKEIYRISKDENLNLLKDILTDAIAIFKSTKDKCLALSKQNR